MSCEAFDILDYRHRAIPPMGTARTKKQDYRTVPINHEGQLSAEEGVDLRQLDFAGENHYFLAKNPPVAGAIPELFLRRSVARQLAQVKDCLRLHRLDIFVKDAFRPLTVQRQIYDRILARIAREQPDLEADAVRRLTEERVASVPDPGEITNSPSPHLTGAAVDLTICRLDGDEMYMGQRVSIDDGVYPDALEHLSVSAGAEEQQAQMNRRLLYWLMTDAGFVVNPTEWWHFSWGDQMWAKLTGAPMAHYGALRL